MILLGTNVLAGSEPEELIPVKTVYLDTDYALDQVRWQCGAYLSDQLNAKGFAEMNFTKAAKIL